MFPAAELDGAFCEAVFEGGVEVFVVEFVGAVLLGAAALLSCEVSARGGVCAF